MNTQKRYYTVTALFTLDGNYGPEKTHTFLVETDDGQFVRTELEKRNKSDDDFFSAMAYEETSEIIASQGLSRPGMHWDAKIEPVRRPRAFPVERLLNVEVGAN